MPVDLTNLLPQPWQEFVDKEQLREISDNLKTGFIPDEENIFRALQLPPNEVKVVIV